MAKTIQKKFVLIKKLIETNPRRKNSIGYKSWELIKDGMSIEEYVKAGGRTKDLLWDHKKGYVSFYEISGKEIEFV